MAVLQARFFSAGRNLGDFGEGDEDLLGRAGNAGNAMHWMAALDPAAPYAACSPKTQVSRHAFPSSAGAVDVHVAALQQGITRKF